ncbi:hypothetical protein [Nitrosomonas mobilis]|nr:hypothetical protein [Nitrosomonas mobilis]HNO74548.1 hypothetical protein [Nitrosomonas mobilis]
MKQDRYWTPTLPSKTTDIFKMADLLDFAGVTERSLQAVRLIERLR